MNDLLIENLKSIMVYFRNYTDDSDLPQMVMALKDAVRNNGNEIIVQRIKRNMPKMEDWIREGLPSFDYHSAEIEHFLSDCLDILEKAVKEGNTQLVYDLSDMLQGIPDLKYWKSSKNMRDYWKIYVKPVKKKWKLDMLDIYQPKKFFASKIK